MPTQFRDVLTFSAASLCFSLSMAAAQTPISGLSPNPVTGGPETDPAAVTACNGAPQSGLVYRNSETEPYIAINPGNPMNMIAGWHQDRWSTGGGQSLGVAFTKNGGASWTQVILPFTRCSGGDGKAGAYERASDPWISFSPDGTAHYMTLSFDDSVSENALMSVRSTNGGETWEEPAIIARSRAQDSTARSIFNDKNSLTADPFDSRYVYATWTLFRWGNTSLMVSRSTDGGKKWGPPIPIATYDGGDPGQIVFFRQGAQIVVQPGGTLINSFYRIVLGASGGIKWDHAIFRSTDRGKHWTRMDNVVRDFIPTNAFDPELGIPVRDAGEIPDIAVGLDGDLYMVWQDKLFIGSKPQIGVGVYLAKSEDDGQTWSAPVRIGVEELDDIQTFLPAVAVNTDGTVGVLFYDFRNDLLGDKPLSADVWLAFYDEDLNWLGEKRLTSNSMDFRQLPITGDRGYFPGDYVGLDVAGNDFVAAFTYANGLGLPVDFPQDPGGPFVDAADRSNIVFAREAP